MTTSMSDLSAALSDARRSDEPSSSSPDLPRATGRRIGRLKAVAISRAIPMTHMQSGRLPVTSKSMTASAFAILASDEFQSMCSRPSTATPRTDIVFAISSGDAVTSTKSRSHETRIFTAPPSWSGSYRELFEEAQVVLVEEADVVDPVLQHRHALHPHAEREAGVLLGVVADGLEHRRVHHAAAENLEPSRLLARAAPRAAARAAADVDLGARLGVGEEAGTQPHLHVAEERPQHRFERPLQVRERDPLADDEPLELLEHRRVTEIEVVAAVDAPGHDDAHRRRERLHVADLHRRRVRAQQRRGAHLRVGHAPAVRAPRAADDRRVEVERVLHVARGMIGRHVERLEVVEVVLDLRAFENLVAHVREDVLDDAHMGYEILE